MVDRVALPQWPRLMGEQMAARYLSIGHNLLREKGPTPKRLGSRVLYDRVDLDRWADQLDGQPFDRRQLLDARKEAERRYLERQGKA